MVSDWALPDLLETGRVIDDIFAVRDKVVNFFVVRGPEGLVCIDAGWQWESVRSGFKTLGLKFDDVVAVFLTHHHWDHAKCAGLYPNATVYSSENLPHDRKIHAAGLTVRAIPTPGHTPDSFSFLVDKKYLFTGDTVFLRRGKAFPFPSKYNKDQPAVRESIRLLARLKGVECILSAHTGAAFDPAEAFRDWRD